MRRDRTLHPAPSPTTRGDNPPQAAKPSTTLPAGTILGAFGANSKLTDTALGIAILGARAYQAAEGRFLSVDPLEGGCANNYVYVFGDPLNKNDLTGQKCSGWQVLGLSLGAGAAGEAGSAVAHGAAGVGGIAGIAATLISAAFVAIAVVLILKIATGC